MKTRQKVFDFFLILMLNLLPVQTSRLCSDFNDGKLMEPLSLPTRMEICREVHQLLNLYDNGICWHDYCFSPYQVTHLTKDIYCMYVNFRRNEKVLNITQQFIDLVENQRFSKISGINRILMIKCTENIARKLPVEHYERVVNILFTKVKNNTFYRTLFENFLFNIRAELLVSNSQFFVKVWFPFELNVTGVAMYKKPELKNVASYVITEIYANQSSRDVDTRNLEIAGYVPYQQLESLSDDVSREHAQKLRIIMLVVMKNKEFSRMLAYGKNKERYYLGISVPGFYKRNNFAVLKAYLGGRWNKFGENYYDIYDNSPVYMSVLNTMSYFTCTKKRTRETVWRGYRSVTYIKGNTTLSGLLTARKFNYPPRFCMDDDFEIPQSILVTREEHFNCSTNLPESTWTECLYQLYVTYRKNIGNCNRSNVKNDSNLVDFYMHSLMSKQEYELFDPNGLFPLVTKGIELLEKQPSPIYQFAYITKFLIAFSHFFAEEYISEALIHLHVSKNHTVGFIIHSENVNSFGTSQIEYLGKGDIADIDQHVDNTVEVIVYSSDLCWDFTKFYIVNAKNVSQDGQHICKSRVLFIYQLIFCDMTLDVYLKITDYKRMWYNQGFWFKLDLKVTDTVTVCISEPRDNICDHGSKLFIYKEYWKRKSENTDVLEKTIKIEVDVLSQLALSMSPKSKDVHQKHFKILKIVMLVATSFSILGITSILACALLLKGWYKNRTCTIQISLVYLFELAFFLIENDKITHVVYLIFYYSLLTQFCWMCIIGYMKYRKFIKVFESSETSKVKLTLIGWLPSAVVILIPTLIYSDCLKCDLCYNNSSIFAYFVIIPISLIILGNTILYIVILYKLFHRKFPLTPKAKKARLRAAIMFPFLFGITWISTFAMFSDWPTISLIGSYFFHIIVPSQGFVLSIFVVGLDKDTRTGLGEIPGKLFTLLR